MMVLVGCATNDMTPSRRAPDLVPVDQINVPARFETTALTALTISRAVQPCLPWLLTGEGPGLYKLVQDIERSKDGVVVYGHQNSGNFFVMHRELGFCVQRTTALLPILAAEALMDTAHPMGMPAGVLESWQKQIAQRLAVTGQVKVAYHFGNGNAYIVQHWLVSEGSRLRQKYSHVFKRAGEWEKDLIDLQFSHPQASSFLAVGQSLDRDAANQEKTSPIEHRFKPTSLQRPTFRP
jgi:hypothetical protein